MARVIDLTRVGDYDDDDDIIINDRANDDDLQRAIQQSLEDYTRIVAPSHKRKAPENPTSPQQSLFKRHKEQKTFEDADVNEFERNRLRLLTTTYEQAVSALERPINTFLASALDQILKCALPRCTSKTLTDWRKEFGKAHATSSALEMLSEARRALPLKNEKSKKKLDETDLDATTQHVIRDYMAKEQYENDLKDIRPCAASHVGQCVQCIVCFDKFNDYDTISCAVGDAHAVCRSCFHNYLTSTLAGKSTTLSCMPCVSPECKDTYSSLILSHMLPAFYVRKLEAAEHQKNLTAATLNEQVAATMFCECGTVGTIYKEDLLPGAVMVTCVTCRTHYCIKCGNKNHSGRPCPPPLKTLEWVTKNTKECSKCRSPIEKNDGCNHMTCRCGYEFCWLCLGPYRRCKCPLYS